MPKHISELGNAKERWDAIDPPDEETILEYAKRQRGREELETVSPEPGDQTPQEQIEAYNAKWRARHAKRLGMAQGD